MSLGLTEAGFTGAAQLKRAPYTVLVSPLPGESGSLVQYLVEIS